MAPVLWRTRPGKPAKPEGSTWHHRLRVGYSIEVKMSESGKGRRAIGNALIVAGAVVILALGGYFGWTRYQGERLRANLRSTPAPVAAVTTSSASLPTVTFTPAATVSPTPVPPTAAATELTQSPVTTQAQPTNTATAVPFATAVPPATAAPAAAPTAVPAPVSVGPPVRIVIPDLEIAAPVVEMGWQVVETANGPQSEWDMDALKGAVGHHINSAELGEPGNIVISGHNNIFGREFEAISMAWDDDSRARVDDYTDSSDILNGRTIQLYNAAGQQFDYTITAFYRLRDTGVSLAQRIENARFMQPTADRQLTLVTCWPPWNNTHRLIVVAQPAGGS